MDDKFQKIVDTLAARFDEASATDQVEIAAVLGNFARAAAEEKLAQSVDGFTSVFRNKYFR